MEDDLALARRAVREHVPNALLSITIHYPHLVFPTQFRFSQGDSVPQVPYPSLAKHKWPKFEGSGLSQHFFQYPQQQQIVGFCSNLGRAQPDVFHALSSLVQSLDRSRFQ